jgi:4-amino-4-deoxy-L-arabinose transferase-like glycosyltransferase
MYKYPKAELLYVMLFAVIIFIPFTGAVHLFDWDEINFAESAREMLLTGEYFRVQINYRAFWEKPPLFFWLQVLSMKVFGINEFAARFPNAVCGIITLGVLFHVASKHFSRNVAIWWVLLMAGSITPHLYFKSGIIDPWFNLFIFLGVYQLIQASSKASGYNMNHFLFAGLFAGLAFLTKGPVALIIIGLTLCVYLVVSRFKLFFGVKHVLSAFAVFIFISSIWVLPEFLANGYGVIFDFIAYQADLFLNPVAGHGQPFWYHPVVLLIGCFPASIFFIPATTLKHIQPNNKNLSIWMNILFWVVLILFSSVTTKIVHYSSMCYIPLTFIAATYISELVGRNQKIHAAIYVLLLLLGVVISTLLTLLPLVDRFKGRLVSLIKDPFVVENLSISSPWLGYEYMVGFAFLIVFIFALLLIKQQRLLTAFRLILLGNAVLLPFYMYTVVPKVEAYTQRSAIVFYKQLAGQDVYIETLGHKSYAQYFYAQTLPENKPSVEQMLYEEQGKDCYFVSKTTYIDSHDYPQLIEIARNGGFVLLKKKVN